MSDESAAPVPPPQEQQGDDADALFREALARDREGRPDEAVRLLTCVLDAAPRHAGALSRLGLIAARRGDHHESAAFLSRALEIDPRRADAWANLGSVLMALDRADEARSAYEKALALQPDETFTLRNLARLSEREGRHRAAAALYRRVVEITPNDGEAWFSLGVALQQDGQAEEAVEAYSAAAERNPNHFATWGNLGGLLRRRGAAAEAIAALRKALALRPEDARLHVNLGNALRDSGDPAGAEAAYREALRLAPELDRAKALIARLSQPPVSEVAAPKGPRRSAAAADLRLPAWDGSPLGEKCLLIRAAAGIGEQLRLGVLLHEVAARGRRVTVECDARLTPLFARSFESLTLVPPGSSPEPATAFDLQAALEELPSLVGLAEGEAPRRRGSLRTDPDRVADLAADYLRRARGRFLVGLSWRQAHAASDGDGAIALSDLLPVLKQPGCRFVSLEADDAAGELETLHKDHGIEVLRDESVDPHEDLDGLAAQIAALDLVIAIGNRTAHLAGAVGAPSWVLLPSAPSWHWTKEGGDSPWYSSQRLFRQEAAGGWGPVIARVGDALDALVAAQAG